MQSSRRSASPSLAKGKLEAVKKMYAKEEEKSKDLEEKLEGLTTRKLELEKNLNERMLAQKDLNEKQEEEEEKTKQEKAALEASIHQLGEELHKLKDKKTKLDEEHHTHLEEIKSENKRLEDEL
jgi:DNA repair exonuclease SbcCD ATPase subunit